MEADVLAPAEVRFGADVSAETSGRGDAQMGHGARGGVTPLVQIESRKAAHG